MGKKNFKENFNFITNIFILFILLFGGFIWADSNGVWTLASDIRPGIFGSDENDGNYTFNDSVLLEKDSYYKGEELNQKYVNEGQANSINSTMIVDNSIGGDELQDSINTDLNINGNFTVNNKEIATKNYVDSQASSSEVTTNLALDGYLERVGNFGTDQYGGLSNAYYSTKDTCDGNVGTGSCYSYSDWYECSIIDPGRYFCSEGDEKSCVDVFISGTNNNLGGITYKKRKITCFKETIFLKVEGGTPSPVQSCSSQGVCNTAPIDICLLKPELQKGDQFMIESDVSGSDWVYSPNTILRTINFTKGVTKTDTIKSSGGKRNGNSRIYDGGCNIIGKSWYEGDGTKYSNAAIKITLK